MRGFRLSRAAGGGGANFGRRVGQRGLERGDPRRALELAKRARRHDAGVGVGVRPKRERAPLPPARRRSAQRHGHHRADAVLRVVAQRLERGHGAGIPELAEGEHRHFPDVGVRRPGARSMRGASAARSPRWPSAHAATPRVAGSSSLSRPVMAARAPVAPRAPSVHTRVAPRDRIQVRRAAQSARARAGSRPRGGSRRSERRRASTRRQRQDRAPAGRPVIEPDVQNRAHALRQRRSLRHGQRAARRRHRAGRRPARCRADARAYSIGPVPSASTRSSQACSCSSRARRAARHAKRIGPMQRAGDLDQQVPGVVAAADVGQLVPEHHPPPFRVPAPGGRGSSTTGRRKPQLTGTASSRLIATRTRPPDAECRRPPRQELGAAVPGGASPPDRLPGRSGGCHARGGRARRARPRATGPGATAPRGEPAVLPACRGGTVAACRGWPNPAHR